MVVAEQDDYTMEQTAGPSSPPLLEMISEDSASPLPGNWDPSSRTAVF